MFPENVIAAENSRPFIANVCIEMVGFEKIIQNRHPLLPRTSQIIQKIFHSKPGMGTLRSVGQIQPNERFNQALLT
jgi:hypothetical protein